MYYLLKKKMLTNLKEPVTFEVYVQTLTDMTLNYSVTTIKKTCNKKLNNIYD